MKQRAIILLAAAGCVAGAEARAQQTPQGAPGQTAPQQQPPVSPPGQTPPQTPAGAENTPGVPPELEITAPEGIRQMRLSEVLDVTVRQAPSLAQAVIDVRVADAAILEAAGIDDWALRAAVGWSSQRFAGLDQLQNSASLSADLTRSLPTGGTVTLHGDTGFSSNVFRISPDEPENTYSHTVALGVSHSLWRGLGEKYARAGQTRASIQRSAAELDVQASALSVVREVVAAYWELAYAWRDLEIRRASLALAEEQLRNTQARIQAGAVAPTEALAVEQTILSRREAILNAELSITERSLALRTSAGLEVGAGEVELWASAPLALSPRGFDTNALLSQSLAQNPILTALAKRQEELALNIDVAENSVNPDLNLDVLLGPTGSGGNVGAAFEELIKFNQLAFDARLTLSHSFGQSTARGRLEVARQQLYRFEVDIRQTRDQITRDLLLAVRQAETAQQRIGLNERVIELSLRNIEAEKARFELGRSTNFDVLQRQDELEQAQLARARAVVDYLQALTAIDAQTGDLLGRYGIAFPLAEE
ncbi:TolC family protein [Haliangium ochraceum]|uniref:Outer membrane efflux protein n=1 Tax=Haliangium ochraceum (strain DSM 14365 / JCM 11303 / SMP-2) TaxID=502025 RepID=D0LP52_HALO1|nr:TolC family protein [Haliangium ochraceum]ACY18878.1 outer membrane efflux protein [Haliangium ochraceum DSM 14365]